MRQGTQTARAFALDDLTAPDRQHLARRGELQIVFIQPAMDGMLVQLPHAAPARDWMV
jgi:hypothetical protein